MLIASPASIQMIQAGQNDPWILSIGSQAVKKTAKSAGNPAFRNPALYIFMISLKIVIIPHCIDV